MALANCDMLFPFISFFRFPPIDSPLLGFIAYDHAQVLRALLCRNHAVRRVSKMVIFRFKFVVQAGLEGDSVTSCLVLSFLLIQKCLEVCFYA